MRTSMRTRRTRRTRRRARRRARRRTSRRTSRRMRVVANGPKSVPSTHLYDDVERLTLCGDLRVQLRQLSLRLPAARKYEI